jgi:cytosine/adenosine deaminase-related metal-dependent hydrolase
MGHPTYFLQGALVPDYVTGDGYGYKTVDVTLSGGVIASMRPAGEAPPPAGAELVDCKDKLLIPGSVNAHTHTSEHWARGVRFPGAAPRRCLEWRRVAASALQS